MKWILLTAVMIISCSCIARTALSIRSLFDINSAYCAIKTNGVLGMDNRHSALAGRGSGTASTNAMLFMENGQNEITVEIGALGWFDKNNREHRGRIEFDQNAYCKLDVILFQGTQENTISQMDIGINSDGIPFDKINYQTIRTAKIAAPQVVKGHIPEGKFNSRFYPEGMVLYQFTKTITLKRLPEWKWKKATSFTSTPAQLNELKLAYMDLWKLFSNRDNLGIKNFMKESSFAWSVTTGDNINDIYNNEVFIEDLKNPSMEMLPINWNDYNVDTYNKGRMVRLANKSNPNFSPIAYYVIDENGKKRLFTFSPIFSIINGKAVLVI